MHIARGEMSYIIAVANQKGGVAKTTTAVSLGGALVKNGYQVLLIDLDPQADLTLGMGLTPRLIRGSIADVLLSSSSITSLCRETNIPGLDLPRISSCQKRGNDEKERVCAGSRPLEMILPPAARGSF